MSKKSPKRVINDHYFCIKIPGCYGDMEIYPKQRSIRSYNKQILKKHGEDFENFKTNKKGFVEYY